MKASSVAPAVLLACGLLGGTQAAPVAAIRSRSTQPSDRAARSATRANHDFQLGPSAPGAVYSGPVSAARQNLDKLLKQLAEGHGEGFRRQVGAMTTAGSLQRKAELCQALSPSIDHFSNQASLLAQEIRSSIEVGVSTSFTALFFNQAWGASLVWGEDGSFACSNDFAHGLDLELIGASHSTSISYSPTNPAAGFGGGWDKVGASKNHPDQCYSISWNLGYGVTTGIGAAMQFPVGSGPDRMTLPQKLNGLISSMLDEMGAEVARQVNPTTGDLNFGAVVLAALSEVAEQFGATSMGLENTVSVGTLDVLLDLFLPGASIPLPAMSVTNCAQELVYCEGPGCAGKKFAKGWSDGTLCGVSVDLDHTDILSTATIQGTCEKCASPHTYWYSKAMTACGKEPKTWTDGTHCGIGTTCKICKNGHSYWWSKAMTACGDEPKWADGTRCAIGTTCKACLNGHSYWWKFGFTSCGQEPKWRDGSRCAAGTTCKACANEHSYHYSLAFTACGKEAKTWPDGKLCGIGTTCKVCKNGHSYWWSRAFTACGKEPCKNGGKCLAGTTCNRCCNGKKWKWKKVSYYCK